MSSRETFDRYAAAWGTLDPRQIAAFYGFPCLASPSIHAIARDREELLALLGPTIEGMKSSDYARSEIADLRVRALGVDLEEVTCQVTRLNRSGDAFVRVNAVYFWRRNGDEWRLITSFAGDPL